jgi:xanthine dehydrogenase molybdopterin-binding subunit B
VIGQSLRRVEDPQLLQGRGTFADDVRLDGAFTLGIMSSPHPHARIRSISTEAARHMHGVVDILTGADTENVSMMFLQRSISELRQPRCTPLAFDEVRYVGEPVAAVLASGPAIAADARDLIDFDYEPIPSVADAEAALKPDAPLVHAASAPGTDGWRSEVDVADRAPYTSYMSPADHRYANYLTVIAAVKSGTTTLCNCDRYHPELTVEAAEEIGIRTLSGAMANDPGFRPVGRPNWPDVKDTMIDLIETHRSNPLRKFFVGAHSPYSCPPEQ